VSDRDLSIHPRNWPKTGTGEKKNTCGKRGEKCRKLDRKLKKLSRRQLARDASVRSVKSKNPEGAFRRPGSMND
jgi:hypothetical protein